MKTGKAHRITDGSLSRLLPSDLVMIRSMAQSNLSRGNLTSLVAEHFTKFQKPTANDLAHVYKLSSQLNTAGFWDFVDPVGFLKEIKGNLSQATFNALRESLDVPQSDVAKDKESQVVSKVKTRTYAGDSRTVRNPKTGAQVVIPGIASKRLVAGVKSLVNAAGKKSTQSSNVKTGTVKWFNEAKGFGFIAPEGGGKDVFVHITALERAGIRRLSDNQKVTFELDGDNVSKILEPSRPGKR